eukprot:3941399-Rhodomonas_salina.6
MLLSVFDPLPPNRRLRFSHCPNPRPALHRRRAAGYSAVTLRLTYFGVLACAIALCTRYAMSGTDAAYRVLSCYVMSGTELGYRVLSSYAMCSTERVYGATPYAITLRNCYVMPGTDLSYPARLLVYALAMQYRAVLSTYPPRTAESGYLPTSLLCVVRYSPSAWLYRHISVLCDVASGCIGVRACYAMSSTDTGKGCIGQRACYAMPSTDMAYCHTRTPFVQQPEAMSGTDPAMLLPGCGTGCTLVGRSLGPAYGAMCLRSSYVMSSSASWHCAMSGTDLAYAATRVWRVLSRYHVGTLEPRCWAKPPLRPPTATFSLQVALPPYSLTCYAYRATSPPCDLQYWPNVPCYYLRSNVLCASYALSGTDVCIAPAMRCQENIPSYVIARHSSLRRRKGLRSRYLPLQPATPCPVPAWRYRLHHFQY